MKKRVYRIVGFKLWLKKWRWCLSFHPLPKNS